MTRKEFIKLCGIFGISLPIQSTLLSLNNEHDTSKSFSGKVLIIGAGAGGLTAGYLLKQQGIDFEILEASSAFGGRMKINKDFADFPIPLGAEWLETNPSIFNEIVNDSSVQVKIETITDHPDRKFINYSWFNFFEEYIIPTISNKIRYNTIVEFIDYSKNKITVKTQSNYYTADKIIISVPLAILKEEKIRFFPKLPQNKLDAIKEVKVWEGFKAFFEFSTNFYDEGIEISMNKEGEKIYYNASLGQNTSKNIIGLFAVGKPALDYINLSENELKKFILDELDILYSNKATPNYIKHITQNWNNEPFIKGGYLTNYANWKAVKELGKSISDKIYFAGSEYTDGEDWGSVHNAAKSAKNVVKKISTY